jgi:hypothetical protein
MGAPTDEQTPHPQSRVQGQSRHGGDQWPQDDPGDRRRPRHPPDPGEPVEAAAAGWSQRAVYQGQADQGQGGRAGQGSRAVPADRPAADGAGVAQKKVSAAVMLVNYESWWITTTLNSASAANACCWACLDPRCITGPHRCGNRRCGSWQGSMLSIWKIPAAAAAGWWPIWPEMRSRSAVIGCETSCAAWGYGRSTRNPAQQCPGIHPSVFHAWWISAWSRQWIRCGPLISPTSRCRKAFSTWWRSWISFPGMCSAGSCPTALTRSSVWRLWRWRWKGAASQRSSTPTKDASLHPLSLFPGYMSRRSVSVGQDESVATTTSSSNAFGGQSSTRRCTCVPTAMAGRPRSAWPDSYGGTAM